MITNLHFREATKLGMKTGLGLAGFYRVPTFASFDCVPTTIKVGISHSPVVGSGWTGTEIRTQVCDYCGTAYSTSTCLVCFPTPINVKVEREMTETELYSVYYDGTGEQVSALSYPALVQFITELEQLQTELSRQLKVTRLKALRAKDELVKKHLAASPITVVSGPRMTKLDKATQSLLDMGIDPSLLKSLLRK
jgi:hypothetical protein